MDHNPEFEENLSQSPAQWTQSTPAADSEPQPTFPQEPAAEQPTIPSPEPSTSEKKHKQSPYASSPYVMNPPTEYTYQTQTGKQPSQQNTKGQSTSRSGGSFWKGMLAAVLTIALVVVGCGITATYVDRRWEAKNAQTVDQLNQRIDSLVQQLDESTANAPGIITQQLPSSGSGLAPSQLYAQNVDCVVAVTSTVEQSSYYGTSEGSSCGSGFILTQDGYVVTNAHVVEQAKSVTVTTHNGTEYAATIKGYDTSNDIAVLKVDAEGLPTATLGSSSSLLIGDMVVAIGNPLGELTATQTVGYVSGINREITTDNTIISMIQTDAAINPGNSGGPLFNMFGQVVGITTAKYSGTTSSGASIEGIGFAIPIDDVLSIINDLVEYGHVTGAYLGVTVQNTDADSAAMFGLPTGAYVLEVVSGASADRAGIQVKDLIIGLNDQKISSITDLTRALRNYKAGDVVTITVLRSGKEVTLEVTLDEKPVSQSTYPTPDSNMPSEGNYEEWFKWFFGTDPNGD